MVTTRTACFCSSRMRIRNKTVLCRNQNPVLISKITIQLVHVQPSSTLSSARKNPRPKTADEANSHHEPKCQACKHDKRKNDIGQDQPPVQVQQEQKHNCHADQNRDERLCDCLSHDFSPWLNCERSRTNCPNAEIIPRMANGILPRATAASSTAAA